MCCGGRDFPVSESWGYTRVPCTGGLCSGPPVLTSSVYGDTGRRNTKEKSFSKCCGHRGLAFQTQRFKTEMKGRGGWRST